MSDVLNPYTTDIQPVKQPNDTEGSRAIAEVQAMVVMAKRFPRNPIQATDRILNECQRPKLAEQALYTYSRGGTDISGPSIRLAEAIARNWGNLDAGVKELSRENGQSEMMSYCWDLETNIRHVKIFNVDHWRDTKKGGYALKDSRDIYELTANHAARRLRAAILAAIPSDVIEAAVKQCEKTLQTNADTSSAAVKKMVSKFKEIGVEKSHIEARIQRKVDAITAAQIVSLRNIYNSINDGMSRREDWFDIPKKETSEDSAKLTKQLKGNPPEKPEKPEVSEADKKRITEAARKVISDISAAQIGLLTDFYFKTADSPSVDGLVKTMSETMDAFMDSQGQEGA